MTAANLKRGIEQRGGTAEITEDGGVSGELAGYEIALAPHHAKPGRGFYTVHRAEDCACDLYGDYYCGSFFHRINELDQVVGWEEHRKMRATMGEELTPTDNVRLTAATARRFGETEAECVARLDYALAWGFTPEELAALVHEVYTSS